MAEKKSDFKKFPKKGDKAPVQFLVSRQIRLMLGLLMRDLKSFRAVRKQLVPEKFPADQAHLAEVWRIAQRIFDENNRLPFHEEVCAECEAWLADEDGNGMVPDDRLVEELGKFLSDTYSRDEKEVAESQPKALQYARRFLTESARRELREATKATVLPELPALLESLTNNARQVQSLAMRGRDQAFPDDLEAMPMLDKVPTLMPYMDDFLGGGQVKGEVYGFVAPIGVCKSLTSVQLCVNRVSTVRAEWKLARKKLPKAERKNLKMPVVYLIMYEEEISSVRMRALSCAAGVNRTPMEDGNYDFYSSTAKQDFKPYEVEEYAEKLRAGEGHECMGELDRINMWRKHFNGEPTAGDTGGLQFVDFTGAREEYQEMAGNYVDGIVSYIEKD